MRGFVNSRSIQVRSVYIEFILWSVLAIFCAFLCAGDSWAAAPKIAAGYDHTVTLLSDGTLWTWGANSSGQVGDGTGSDRLSPFRIEGDAAWSDIAAGKFYTLAVRSDGTLWAWGANNYGQVGDGTAVNRLAPVRIGTDTDWASVASGTVHSLALKTNGTLWAWGRNSSGQIGDGTKIDRLAPVRIGTDADWAAVAAGTSHSLAVKSDGTLWAWGGNDLGQLGDGTHDQRSEPVRIGTDTDWAAVEGGDKFSLAQKAGGGLWGWGHGQADHPVLIDSDSVWASLSASAEHAFGLRTDGALWAAGENEHGQLGDGTTEWRFSPVQIGPGTAWMAIATGEDHTAALADDGGVWTWGSNIYGQLGDGTLTGRLLPAPLRVHTITPAAESSGSISPSTPQDANWGASLSFTVNPDPGYRIAAVTGCGGTLTGTTYTTGPAISDCTVTATFEIDTYTLTATAGSHGSITPSGLVVVTGGASQSFTCTPEPGYHVEAVLVDGVLVGPFRPQVIGIPLGDPWTYTFSSVTASHAISADFAPNPTVTITATAGANGSITPSGAVSFLSETDKTFAIAPSAGYVIADVQVDGLSVGAVSSYTFTKVMTDHAITASFAPQTARVISASAGPNGTISPSGEVTVAYGGSKTFFITPATGYRIRDVVVDGVSVGMTTSYQFVSVTANHTISATFAPAIIAATGPNGTISPRGITVVPIGNDATYTITPYTGYHIADVVVDGVSLGQVITEPPLSRPYTYTFTNVVSPHSISATFEPNPTMIISALAGPNGTISPSGEVPVLSETSKSFYITPATGYRIADVVVDGASVGTSTTYQFVNVTANHTIRVTFSPVITSSAGLNGTISPRGTTVVPSGSDASYTITPFTGYHIADVVVDGVSLGQVYTEPPLTRPYTYTFTNVTTPHSISATFAPNPTMIISASAGPNGTITPAGEVGVLSETSKSFTITPNSGYRATVTVDGVPVGTVSTYQFVNVTANHTISVTFAPTITSTSGANGTISPRGTTVVPSGSDAAYTITPSTGYHIADVVVDGVSLGQVYTEPPLSRPYTYTFMNVVSPHSISVTFAPNPTMIISALAGPNGTISPSGEVPVLSETSKSFSITPATGYRIADVVVDGASVGTSTTYQFVNVTANHTIRVTFSPVITSSAGLNGTISPRGTTVVPSGGSVSYTMTPSNGYHIADVVVDGVSLGQVYTEPPLTRPYTYTFTNVTTPHSISATFAPNPTMIISAGAGPNGTISPSGEVPVLSETNKSFYFAPATGYRVADVVVDGVSVGTSVSYQFVNVTANHTITVIFAPVITSTSGANGTISPKGTTVVPSGSDATYTITAFSGYHIADVIVDGASVGAVATYTFTNVVSPHSISASFAANP